MWNKGQISVTVPPPTPDRFSIGCLLLADRSKQPIEKRSGVGGGTVTLGTDETSLISSEVECMGLILYMP